MVDERDHGNEIASQIAPAQVERRLEQERRQHDVEDEIMRQREASVAARSGERRARKHEPDGVGETQASRRERDQYRKAKQAQRAKEQNVHAAQFSGALWKENRRARR